MGLILSKNPWQRRTIIMQADLPCVYCTYNLRGLPISDNCPECGRQIWDSLLTRGVSALHRSSRSAAIYCALAGLCPLLISALLAMSHSASPPEPIVATLAITVCVILAAGIGWFTLPVTQFQPSDRDKLWIIALMVLSVTGVSVACILGLTLPAANAHWIAPVWTATILSVACYLMRLMGTAARILFVINHPVASRCLQTAQVFCIAAAAVCLASLAMEFSDDPDGIREVAIHLAAIAGLAVMLAASAAALAFSAYGPR